MKTILLNRLLLLILLQCSYTRIIQAEWIDYRFPVMGTEVRVRFFLKDEVKAEAAKQAVITEMHRIDNNMSPFKSDSLLSRVNRDAATSAVTITSELFKVIENALNISKLTHGAFDISFSSIGYLYDYRKGLKPSNTQLQSKLNLIDYRSIILNKKQSSIFFKHKGMKIDLGGIAKGLSVDNCIAILKSFGVKDASVTAGGDTYALGDNAGKMWNVGIQHPRHKKEVLSILPLANTAISTSGDYERFFIEDGKRYHHIINPKTGKSASEVQSVTILANTSVYADALSTSVFILGVTDGLKLAESLNNVSAIIVDRYGKMFYTRDLVQAQ